MKRKNKTIPQPALVTPDLHGQCPKLVAPSTSLGTELRRCRLHSGHSGKCDPVITEEEMLATTCFHCGDQAMPSTHGFDPRCERHRDV